MIHVRWRRILLKTHGSYSEDNRMKPEWLSAMQRMKPLTPVQSQENQNHKYELSGIESLTYANESLDCQSRALATQPHLVLYMSYIHTVY